jgi:hypothetical protein
VICRFGLLVILLWSVPAPAVELRQVSARSGTDGLLSVPVTVVNTGAEPLVCTAQLAHWYSSAVGTAASGGRARIDLWFDPATGTFLLLNGKRENMPVESLWCGIAGRAYETRDSIVLDRGAGAKAAARVIGCAASNNRLVCK